MDPIIIEFLLGVFGGTAAGLAATKRVARSRRKVRKRSSRIMRKKTVGIKSKSGKARITPRIGIEQAQVGPVLLQSPAVVPAILPKFSACPSCGIEGSNALLTEHYLSSPAHSKPRKPLIIVDSDLLSRDRRVLEDADARAVMEEEHKTVVRNLLSMLVPPRAFGRRHQDQSHDPVADIVQTIESKRHIEPPVIVPVEKR